MDASVKSQTMVCFVSRTVIKNPRRAKKNYEVSRRRHKRASDFRKDTNGTHAHARTVGGLDGKDREGTFGCLGI